MQILKPKKDHMSKDLCLLFYIINALEIRNQYE